MGKLKTTFSYLFPSFKKEEIYYIICFLVNFFLFSCSLSNSSKKVDPCDFQKAEAFLEELLFLEGGCFTLFGDKPVTSMLIYEDSNEISYLDKLSPEALETLHYIDSHTADHFKAWKKFSKDIQQNNFFLVELPVENDPTCTILYLVNVPEIKKIFKRFFDKISKKTGVQNWKPMLQRLKEPDITLWRTLFKDHYISGLLYGYGEENCNAFASGKKGKLSSGNFQGKITKENFPIPSFIISEEDKVSEKYKNQAKLIKKIYQNRTILEVSMEAFGL